MQPLRLQPRQCHAAALHRGPGLTLSQPTIRNGGDRRKRRAGIEQGPILDLARGVCMQHQVDVVGAGPAGWSGTCW